MVSDKVKSFQGGKENEIMVEHLFSICCEVRGISNNGLSFHLQPYVWALLLIILFGRKGPVSILSPANYAGLEVAVQTVYKNLNPCTTHTRTYAIVLLTFLVFLRVITAPSCYWHCSFKNNNTCNMHTWGRKWLWARILYQSYWEISAIW